jgi:hypothetical protein
MTVSKWTVGFRFVEAGIEVTEGTDLNEQQAATTG